MNSGDRTRLTIEPRRKEHTVPETATHINQLGRVIIPVSDQDRSLGFYTDKLGFEVRADVPFGDGDRWLEVAPPGSGAAIAIMPPRPGETPNNTQTCVAFTTDDLDAAHTELKERGVDVDEPMGGEGPVPRMFFFRDLDRNNLLLVEENES
jgi:catechol 2,3-dioxygenase-like lactoylglutathione lyase family enzyme